MRVSEEVAALIVYVLVLLPLSCVVGRILDQDSWWIWLAVYVLPAIVAGAYYTFMRRE